MTDGMEIEADGSVESHGDRARGVALWRQIDGQLSADIASGTWQPGERLPTEQALAERFEVNRHTIRRAIQSMVQRGLLRVEQGRGTFVQEGVIDFRIGHRAHFGQGSGREGRETSGTTLRVADVLPPLGVARMLKIHPRTPAIMLERLSLTGETPVSLTTLYLPSGRFGGFARIFAEAGSLPAAVARFGITEQRRGVTRVTARLPSAEEARLLRQPATRPILQSEALYLDPEERPVWVAISRFASDRVQIVFDPTDIAA